MGLLYDVYHKYKRARRKDRVKRVSSRKQNGIQQHAIIKSLRLKTYLYLEALPANKTLTRLSTEKLKQ